MARYPDRARLNEKAVEILRRYMKRKSFRTAVVIAAIFVEIRLRTLISFDLRPKRMSKSQFRAILKDERWSFSDLVNWARKLQIITSSQKGKLSDLGYWRNQVAHEMKYWTSYPEVRVQQKLRLACDNAIEFMQNTAEPVD